MVFYDVNFFISECQSTYLGKTSQSKEFPSPKVALLDTFQILIRAGVKEGINDILKRQKIVIDIANTSFELGINIKKKVRINKNGGGKATNESDKYQNDQNMEMIEMLKQGNLGKLKVTSLQLALLAQQTSSVAAILANQIEMGVAKEDEIPDEKIVDETAEKIINILGSQISLQFEEESDGLIGICDSIIMGMNVFHLASHVHPEGLHKILETLNSLPQAVKKIIGPKVTQLLLNINNKVLRYTPLHVATKKSEVDSVR